MKILMEAEKNHKSMPHLFGMEGYSVRLDRRSILYLKDMGYLPSPKWDRSYVRMSPPSSGFDLSSMTSVPIMNVVVVEPLDKLIKLDRSVQSVEVMENSETADSIISSEIGSEKEEIMEIMEIKERSDSTNDSNSHKYGTDSTILYDVCDLDELKIGNSGNSSSSSNNSSRLFDSLVKEIDFCEVLHRGGAIPRLFSIQGEFYSSCPIPIPTDTDTAATATGNDNDNVKEEEESKEESEAWIPIYRHPIDNEPSLQQFSPLVRQIKNQIEETLYQSKLAVTEQGQNQTHENLDNKESGVVNAVNANGGSSSSSSSSSSSDSDVGGGGVTIERQIFNHVLIQQYRGGLDYISEHADKTLDIQHGTDIVNYSFYALDEDSCYIPRILTLRSKESQLKEEKEEKGEIGGACNAKILKDSQTSITERQTHTQTLIQTQDDASVSLTSYSYSSSRSRDIQRVSLSHNSLFCLGWDTNRLYTHAIKQDKRDSSQVKKTEYVSYHNQNQIQKMKLKMELLEGGGGDGGRSYERHRISFTFRTIATFQHTVTGTITGQGSAHNFGSAKATEANEANEATRATEVIGVVDGVTEREVTRDLPCYLDSFRRENKTSMTWEDLYGGGRDKNR